ncbi:helix-turn-helix domain-containing protein [Blautia obeum]|uniref:helix-turn-helix domain-containing protein n=2 Tax=Blautia obeum TaxID=40520 RepID=UPI001FAA3548|nr:helix-turn-helix transcriptional regulator [Blautia obeum]
MNYESGGGQNSAREMSLALGQNPSYINRIENGKALPSMQGFFSICDYLKITPAEFFNDEVEQPGEIRALVEKLQKLPQEQLQLVEQITEQFLDK